MGMNRDNQLKLFKDFIVNCTTNANSLKNYIDFKRINECLQQLFPETKDVSILDFDDAKTFETVVNRLDQLESYVEFNAKGKNQYSTTVGWYQRFLNAKNIFSKQDKIIRCINNRTDNLPLQQIFYGAPGTGKSHRIKEIIQEKGIDEKEQVIRTTFHPDSDYSTFVGCYKPIMKSVPQTYVVEGKEKPVINSGTNLQSAKDEIVYDYTPQAFVQAYTKAWITDKTIILVIEEINRGNCAQIFGDIFQLLDRGDDGVSDYEIKPDKALEDYLKSYFAQFSEAEIPEQIRTGEIMKLPANLCIWATMNTSDQSLFPIDSAFKRRWEWKYTKIVWPYRKNDDGTFKLNENGEKIHFNYTIEGGHDWWKFLLKINAIIDKMTNSADKQLGYFFAKAKDNIISYDTFVSKVCFYLWNDIFKTYALDEQQSDLFSYTNTEGQKAQLTFPAFYDGDGNVIKEVAEAFIGNVLNWNQQNGN